MLIGLTGAAFAGKDTAGAYLARAHNFSPLAFADPLRDGLEAMFDLTARDFAPARKELVIDWIGKSPRQLMQTLGTEWGLDGIHPELWVRHMARRIDRLRRHNGDDIIITDLRFPDEAALIRRLGGEIWRIHRPGAATTAHSDHRSERAGQAIEADRHLDNSGTIEQLYEQIDAAIGYIFETAGGQA